jgi:hypothetical protein
VLQYTAPEFQRVIERQTQAAVESAHGFGLIGKQTDIEEILGKGHGRKLAVQNTDGS